MNRILTILAACLLASCAALGGGQGKIDFQAVHADVLDAQATLTDLADLYRPTRPETTQKLAKLAQDLDPVEKLAQAVATGQATGADLATQIDAFLASTVGVTWSDDQKVQTDVQAALVAARALLRLAKRLMQQPPPP